MPQEPNKVYQYALSRAADILGGKEKLRAYLRVPMHRLEAWLATPPPPMDLFLRAVDVISNRGTAQLVERAVLLRQSSARIVRESQRVLAEAGRVRQASIAMRGVDRHEVLEAALEAAIGETHADMGNVQLAGADGLRIVAQRGFRQPFLDFFAVVGDDLTACGRALRDGCQVVVPDVERHGLFAGTQAGAVMLDAGARAVQSTPLLGPAGEVLGVLSTHYGQPHAPDARELAAVDDITRRAASLLQ